MGKAALQKAYARAIRYWTKKRWSFAMKNVKSGASFQTKLQTESDE